MTGDPELTPQEAAAALLGLESYEETLTAMAFGMTLIAFGIASAATSLAYAHTTAWFVDNGVPWMLSFLWLPFILSAGILTAYLWRTHSLTLHGKEGGGGWMTFGGFCAIYLVIFAGISYLQTWDRLQLSPSGGNLLTLGTFTLLVGAYFQHRYGAGRLIRPTYVAGVLLILVAPLLSLSALDEVAQSLVGALVTLVTWVGAGMATARRG